MLEAAPATEINYSIVVVFPARVNVAPPDVCLPQPEDAPELNAYKPSLRERKRDVQGGLPSLTLP